MATPTGPSIPRSRSLRKPNPPTTTDLTSRGRLGSVSSSTGRTQTNTTSRVPTSRDRAGSPTRLPAPRLASRSAHSSTASHLPASGRNVPSTSTATSTSSEFALKKTRPVSGTLTGRAAPVTGTSTSTKTSSSANPGVSRVGPPRPARSRYPPSASVSGTISSGPRGSSTTTTTSAAATTTTRSKRPSSSGGLTSHTTGSTTTSRSGPGGARLGHTRAKSTVTASSIAAATSATGGLLSSAPILRPPRQNPASTATVTASKTPSISPHHTRNHSAAEQDDRLQTTSRPLSATTTTSSSSSLSRTPSLTSNTTLSSKPIPQLSKRPAFTTLQQHYSPLRKTGPKPLTATYLAPPSPSKRPANIAASAETTRLQTDLLQLHLLHRDAPAVDASWRASARRALQARHADLALRSRQVRDAELEAVERANVAALRAWAGPGASGALEAKIQGLDAVLTGLWGLDGPGGRYARVVRRFEKWCHRMVEADALRQRVAEGREDAFLLLVGLGGAGNAVADDDHVVVGGLDDAWKDDVAGLMRRLDGWARQLHHLGDVPNFEEAAAGPAPGQDNPGGNGRQEAGSSLCRILDGCRSLVRDMLAELAVMEDIERVVVEREMDWIRRMNREEDSVTRHDDSDTPRPGAVWRVV